jgi:hypothetical protein
MGIVVGNFSKGWQNKARRELMQDGALFLCEDLDIDELGALHCRKDNTQDTYFATQTITDEVEDLVIFNLEGREHRVVYYRIGTSLYCWDSYTSETRTVSTSMSGERVSYAALKPLLSTSTYVYITDGVTMFCDTGVTSYLWGIDPPDNLPQVVMAGSGGSLAAGGYSYRYTFYDSDTGAESAPSCVSATTTAVANDSATVSELMPSTNSRVTSRRLYRTVADGGVWYYVGPLNDNATKEYLDGLIDASLGSELTTDQDIPPTGDLLVAYKERLFLAGNVDYPNRVYFSYANKPDMWESTSYLDVGVSNDEIVAMVEFEGKLYFMQNTGICGLYGSDEDTFAYHKTRSHVGVSAPQSVSVGPDGIYFLSHDGVYRFDGLKSVRISDAIDRVFWLQTDGVTEIVDKDTVGEVAKACFYGGKYYLVLPMYVALEDLTNRLVVYDVFTQTWTKYMMNCSCLFADMTEGRVLGGLSVRGLVGRYSVYELMNSVSGSDLPAPEFISKSYQIAGQVEGGRSKAVSWLRRFRVDCKGSWTVAFYVDGTLAYTKALTGQSASTRYKWYSFEPKIKGRYVYVDVTATGGPEAYEWVFNELEIE